MENSISWETDLKKARERAQLQHLPILLFFHNPGWTGCQQMDAVTYPDNKVIEFIQKSFIPLRVPHDAKPLSADFNIKWTPTLITLGLDAKEHHRTVGFLDPGNFIANSLLGIGKYHFDNDRYPEALSFFDTVISDHSQNDAAAEAIFLQGASRYKNSANPIHLKEAYESLSSKYPDSEWTKRAYPYRLL